MDSTVITISDVQGDVPKEKKKFKFSFLPIISFLETKKCKHEIRTWIHIIKVGVALVSVSLLYFLDPLYKEVGDDNAMWAIITVVVIFEFYAGATLSKGLNRGIGTILGGGLGYLVAIFGRHVGGVGNPIIVGLSVFIFGGAATYARLIPSIKRTYDYGAMIFILTFTLVAVPGSRADQNAMEIARERLVMIVVGFAICIFGSLFVFPVWASDELHDSVVSKFEDLATSVEGCLEEYFKMESGKEKQKFQPIASFRICESILYSKSKDESLANFARWEPWHGKFGLSYPWKNYNKIGDALREMAVNVLSLKGCLQAPGQTLKQSIKEPCEAAGSCLAWTLRELGDSIKNMERFRAEASILPKLKRGRRELNPSILVQTGNPDGLTMVFALMGILEKMEELAKEVEELGGLAGFHKTNISKE